MEERDRGQGTLTLAFGLTETRETAEIRSERMRECGSSRLIFTMSGLVNKLRASSPENGGTRRVCLLDSTWQFFTAKSHFGRCSVSDSAHRVDKIENMMKLAATHRMKQKGGPNKGLKFIKLNFEVPPPKNDKLVRYGLIFPPNSSSSFKPSLRHAFWKRFWSFCNRKLVAWEFPKFPPSMAILEAMAVPFPSPPAW